MRFRVTEDNLFGEGWRKGQIIEMDEDASRVRVELGHLVRVEDKKLDSNLDILKDTKNVLDSLEIPFSLACGTALGCVREGDFIGHDEDIDVYVLAEYEYKAEQIIEGMENYGYDTILFGTRGKGFELSFKCDTGKIDIFFMYKKGDKRWQAVYRHGKLIPYVFDAKIIEKMKKVTFRDLKVNIPFSHKKYIEAIYGENWEIPVKVWKYWEDPKCIDLNFNYE